MQLPSSIDMINFMSSSSRSITSVVWRYKCDYWRMNTSFPCPSLLSSKGRRRFRDQNAWLGKLYRKATKRLFESINITLRKCCLNFAAKGRKHHYQASMPFSFFLFFSFFLQIVTSRRNRFLTVLFIDSDISVAPILIAWRSLLLA